jgi:2-oxoglutarate dehydrogenase E1 component
VVASPKKLLRLPAAVSPAADFQPGTRFAPVLASAAAGPIRRVLLCSGKIAYELEAERARRGTQDVVIIRLEQLYPFPAEALRAILLPWRDADFAWVQEEPENMGAWSWLDRRLEALLAGLGARAPRLRYVGRPESPSPAGSFHDAHDADEARLVADAFE